VTKNHIAWLAILHYLNISTVLENREILLKGNYHKKIFIAEYLWISYLYYKYMHQTFH